MKKVLIIAYYFPPLGMGGTQRVAKFIKYLPQFGWHPLVVTVKQVAYYATDETLLQDVEEATIYRTGSLDPQRLAHLVSGRGSTPKTGVRKAKGALQKLLNWLFIPDTKILWLPFAFLKSLQVIYREKPDCLLTTSPPHSVHLLGLVLELFCNLKWVADFRDGWSGGNFQYEPTVLHRWLNRFWQARVVRGADGVVAVSSLLQEKLRAASLSNPSKFCCITNGFDLADVAKAAHVGRNTRFTMTHCGTLATVSQVHGFLEALSDLLSKTPELRNKVAVDFVGYVLDTGVAQQVDEMGLADIVRFSGYLNHLLALEKVLAADLLLYFVSPDVSDDFIPGKTFEYMAAAKGVLAIGPEVEGVKILSEFCQVRVVPHHDLAAIARAIYAFYVTESKERPGSKTHDLGRFEREHLTAQLARQLDSLQ